MSANSTKLSAFCDKVLEMGWLLAVIITPLFFNIHSARTFEPDKLTTLRTVAVIMAVVWLVKYIEERASGQHEIGPALSLSKGKAEGLTWRTPLMFPTLFTVVVYLLSTALSVTFWISLLGSYQRLQGTYTTLSYIVIFLIILQGLRTRAQLDRLITVIIINSLPISLYGLIQRNGLDPLPWAGDVQKRVAGNMGNAIFIAAYLIMVFPLIVGRIAKSFKAILTEEETNWADIPRAASYIFIAAVVLIAFWYANSRGPQLGLIAASYFLFLLLALSSRNKWGAMSALTIIVVIALAVGFLAVVNIPGGPLQSFQRAPWLGRLGRVFDFEHGTGKVRALIWEGMVDLVLPHEPIRYPDGHPDPFNGLRPLVGYGPESIYVAYNHFYPPLLGHHESRTASPDRSHNETLDSLAITGLLGLIAYLWIFGSVFYYGFKWLGLVKDQRQRNLLFGLVAGLSVCSVAFFWWWQGLHFFGAALTLGIVSGLGIYLAIMATISAIHLLRSGEAVLPPLHPHHYLLISLVATFVAHFVEINFGIAIASTRTTFWACAGVFVVAGLNWIGEQREAERQRQETGSRRQGSKKRRKRRKAAPSPAKSALPTWLGPTLAMAIVGAFILSTLAFDFIANAERLTQPLAVIWHALAVLPTQGNRISYGALMIFGLTWLVSGVVFISEMVKGRVFRERQGDGLPATVLYLLTSLTVGFGFALVLASRLVLLVQMQAQTIEEVVAIADRFSGLLTFYYALIVFVLITGGVALLLRARRLPRQGAQPWGGIALIVSAVLASAIIVMTNLHPIQADVVYKYGNPYEQPEQRPIAIAHYRRAIELAPKEDQYYLFLAMPYLEYAASQEDPVVQDTLLRETEQILTEAREINPLQTDHSRNLGVMYMRWMSLVSDPERRQQLAQQAVDNFRIATMLSPHNVLIWNLWASFYLNTGNFELAQETIAHSLELDPEFDESWILQGNIYASQNLITETIGAYEQALEVNPRRTDVLLHLGDIYAMQNLITNAISTYERALEVDPNLTDAWLHLGDTYFRQNRLEEAAAAYEQALGLNPNHTQAWRVLGSVYAQLGRPDEAIAALQQALELDPEASDAWDTHRMLAVIYSQVGQNDTALSHAQIALQLAPEDQQPGLQELVTQLQLLLEGAQP